MATSTPTKSSSLRRRYWVSKAAIENYQAAVPEASADPKVVSDLIENAVKNSDKVEMVIDVDSPAQVIKIDTDLYALVKDNTANTNAQMVVVTVMTESQIAKKWSSGQWSTFPSNFGLPEAAKKALLGIKPLVESNAPQPSQTGQKHTPSEAKTKLYLLSYRLLRPTNGVISEDTPSHREFEYWDTTEQVEDRIEDLSGKIESRSVDVYKRLQLGVRVLDE